MQIALAGDHSAIGHKDRIRDLLRSAGHDVVDCGTNDTASCDYPDYADKACRLVREGTCARAVLICGTGIGMSIAANKVLGIRCALVHSPETARLAGAHNKAQVIALGARVMDALTAWACVQAWLAAPFEDRHQRRLDKIAALESGGSC
jgi:ribose 5-phosphate isomerase B